MANSIFAPTTGTFSPGHDVVGFATGADLPAELASWEPYGVGTGHHPTAAQIMYNAAYSVSHTYSQVKYMFETLITNPGVDQQYVRGAVVVENATISTTGVIYAGYEQEFNISGSGGSGGLLPGVNHKFNGHAELLAAINEDDTNGDGRLVVYNNAGVPTVGLLSNLISGVGPDPTTGAVVTLSQTGSTETGQLPNPA
jgi:hypothetical protein